MHGVEQDTAGAAGLAEQAHRAQLGLTGRQIDALRAVADGASSRVAARRIGVSEQTLSAHLRNAYRTLGVGCRVAALNRLRDHGLLERHPPPALVRGSAAPQPAAPAWRG